MPKLTPEQSDAISEAISRQLYRVNRVVRTMFGQDLSDEEILRSHQRISQGVNESIKQMEQRKSYTPLGGAPQQPQQIPPEVAEGGFINQGGP